MNGQTFTGAIGQSLKRTLDKIVDDDMDGYDSPKKSQYKLWCKESDMPDNWVDDLEMGGPGLWSRKPEGQNIQVGNIDEGVRIRYIAATYAKQLNVTREALEDSKYEKVLRMGRRLKRVGKKTVDIDAHSLLINGFDSTFPGADGVELWGASHPLPGGGTFSNIAAAPAAPSVAALAPIISQIKKMVGHDGIAEGYEPVRILHPTEQWQDWSAILKSALDPVASNLSKINVIKSDYDLKSASLKFWDNTTTHWAVQTDVEDQLQVKWRRRMESQSWVDNSGMNLSYSCSARWIAGYSDPRNSVGANAS